MTDERTVSPTSYFLKLDSDDETTVEDKVVRSVQQTAEEIVAPSANNPEDGYIPQVGEKNYSEGVPVGTLPASQLFALATSRVFEFQNVANDEHVPDLPAAGRPLSQHCLDPAHYLRGVLQSAGVAMGPALLHIYTDFPPLGCNTQAPTCHKTNCLPTVDETKANMCDTKPNKRARRSKLQKALQQKLSDLAKTTPYLSVEYSNTHGIGTEVPYISVVSIHEAYIQPVLDALHELFESDKYDGKRGMKKHLAQEFRRFFVVPRNRAGKNKRWTLPADGGSMIVWEYDEEEEKKEAAKSNNSNASKRAAESKEEAPPPSSRKRSKTTWTGSEEASASAGAMSSCKGKAPKRRAREEAGASATTFNDLARGAQLQVMGEETTRHYETLHDESESDCGWGGGGESDCDQLNWHCRDHHKGFGYDRHNGHDGGGGAGVLGAL